MYKVPNFKELQKVFTKKRCLYYYYFKHIYIDIVSRRSALSESSGKAF